MKSRKFLTMFGFAGLMVAPLLAGCNDSGKTSSSEDNTRYFVNCQTSEDYTISGLSNDGYLVNDLVTFGVNVINPQDKEIASVKKDADVLTAGTDGKYSFAMPNKNVQLSVTVRDIMKYVISYTGTARVDESITFSLSYGTDPVADDFVIEGKSATDKAMISASATDPLTYTCVKAGTCNVVAKINGEIKAELKVTIAKSNAVTIKAAMDAAIKTIPFNGKSGNNSAISTDIYTTIGKVVSIGASTDTKAYNGTVILDDGTGLLPVMCGGGSSATFPHALGTVVKASFKFTNYYGILEAISSTAAAGKSTYMAAEDMVAVNTQVETTAMEEMDGAAFAAYYAECKTNGTTGATKYTMPKFVSMNVKGAGATSDKTFLKIDGDSSDAAGKINTIPTMGVTVDATEDKAFNVKGYMLGANTGNKYGTFHLLEQHTIAVTGVKIVEDSLTTNINRSVKATLEFTPSGATPNTVVWTSANSKIAKANQETGSITGVAEGSTKITVVVDGKYTDTVDINVGGELFPCTKLEVAETSLSIVHGTTTELTVTFEPANCTDALVITSSNQAVATVDEEGVITAVANGSANITVTMGEFTKVIPIVVRDLKILDFDNAQSGDSVDVYGYFMGGYYGKDSTTGYWIGDGNRGLYVYDKIANIQGELKENSILHVVGAYDVYNGGRQVKPTKVTVVDSYAGIEASSTLSLTEEYISTLSAKDQGRKATLTGVVDSATAKTATYNSTAVTYTLKVGNASFKVYMAKNYMGETEYYDFFNKVKEGRTVTIEGFITANTYDTAGKTDATKVPLADYQLVNTKCTASAAPTLTGVKLNETSKEIGLGDTFQLTAMLEPTGAEGAVTWSSDSASGKITVDQTGLVTVAADATANETANITATVTGTQIKATCVVKAVAAVARVTYTKVTADQEDWSGTYVLAGFKNDACYVYNGSTGKDNNQSTTVTENNGKIYDAADEILFIVEKFGSGYSMKVKTTGKYIMGTGASENKTKFSTTAGELAFSYNNGVVVTSTANGITQYLRFNDNGTTGDPLFRFYKNTNTGVLVNFYKLSA